MLYEVITNAGVQGKVLEPLELEKLPDKLTEPGATFVTLTKGKELRGCIGSLEAKRPLAEDVRIHAIAAARITSYNVCYTKLLRWDSGFLLVSLAKRVAWAESPLG